MDGATCDDAEYKETATKGADILLAWMSRAKHSEQQMAKAKAEVAELRDVRKVLTTLLEETANRDKGHDYLSNSFIVRLDKTESARDNYNTLHAFAIWCRDNLKDTIGIHWGDEFVTINFSSLEEATMFFLHFNDTGLELLGQVEKEYLEKYFGSK